MKPYFSVIVPFYNKEKTLAACIGSLLAQEYPKEDYEIIAVDNNSTDGSVTVIKQYPDVRLIRESQQGPYSARNAAIRQAKGTFMAFTDADAETSPDWLSDIRRFIDRGNYDIVIGWFFPSRHIKILELYWLSLEQRIKKAVAENCSPMLVACAANLIIRKEVFEKEGLFRTDSNSEDLFFPIRAMQKGYRVGFSEDIRVKRNDINSIGISLLKEFIYGCVNAQGNTQDKLPISVKIKYKAIVLKFIFQHLPLGIGLILIQLPYYMGYLLSKCRLITPEKMPALLYSYVRFVNKRGL